MPDRAALNDDMEAFEHAVRQFMRATIRHGAAQGFEELIRRAPTDYERERLHDLLEELGWAKVHQLVLDEIYTDDAVEAYLSEDEAS